MQWNNWVRFTSAFFLSVPLIAGEPTSASRTISQPERGMWVWLHSDLESLEGHERLLAFCKKQGIGRIFVEVTFAGRGDAMVLERQGMLAALLRKAGEAGIKVEALDGHQEMSLEKCRVDTLRRLEVLLSFHTGQPEGARFTGLHYDMEPYLGERWRNGDEAGVMRETLETMAAIRERVNRENVALTVAYDIPSWYDRHPDTLAIDFHGERKNFHEHIQDLSDYIGIMSYRREAAKVIDICEAEFAYGKKIGKRVYAALETGELKDEPEISFHGSRPAEFFEAIRAVDEAKKDSPAYGGVFLHYYESVKALVESE